jgi:hypothetical protein
MSKVFTASVSPVYVMTKQPALDKEYAQELTDPRPPQFHSGFQTGNDPFLAKRRLVADKKNRSSAAGSAE